MIKSSNRLKKAQSLLFFSLLISISSPMPALRASMDAQAEYQTLHQRLTSLISERQNIEQNYNQMLQDLNRLQTKYEAKKENLSKEELVSIRNDIATIDNELKSLRGRSVQITQELSVLEAKILELKTKLKDEESKLANHSDIHKTTSTMSGANGTLEKQKILNAETKLAVDEKVADANEKQAQNANQKIALLEEKAKQFEQKIAAEVAKESTKPHANASSGANNHDGKSEKAPAHDDRTQHAQEKYRANTEKHMHELEQIVAQHERARAQLTIIQERHNRMMQDQHKLSSAQLKSSIADTSAEVRMLQNTHNDRSLRTKELIAVIRDERRQIDDQRRVNGVVGNNFTESLNANMDRRIENALNLEKSMNTNIVRFVDVIKDPQLVKRSVASTLEIQNTANMPNSVGSNNAPTPQNNNATPEIQNTHNRAVSGPEVVTSKFMLTSDNSRCPKSYVALFSVNFNQAGEYKYRFVRSDGATSTFTVINVSGPSFQQLMTTWTLSAARLNMRIGLEFSGSNGRVIWSDTVEHSCPNSANR